MAADTKATEPVANQNKEAAEAASSDPANDNRDTVPTPFFVPATDDHSDSDTSSASAPADAADNKAPNSTDTPKTNAPQTAESGKSVKLGNAAVQENKVDSEANKSTRSKADSGSNENANPKTQQSAKESSSNGSAAVPPPPVLKPIAAAKAPKSKRSAAASASTKAESAAQPLLSAVVADASTSTATNKKFPSITSSSPAKDSKLIDDDEKPIKRYTPSGGYYIECFLREVITNIRRNPMMSIASISTVMVLALILGMFTLGVVNLDRLAQELAGEMQIKVYMASTFPAEEAETCRERILKIEHVTGAKFIPKDEAFAHLRERLGSRISLSDLEKNPLPDAYQVPVDDPQYLEQVAQQLHEITAIDKVDYGREEASKLLALNKSVRLVGFIILCLLFASTVLIVSNTIRLTVFARRKEIDIMQLVGAADWFIRWPFILEGVAQGFIGAALSALALDLGYRVVVPHCQNSIAFLPIIAPNEIMPYLCVGLALMGCIVGAIGSLISVNRYLKA